MFGRKDKQETEPQGSETAGSSRLERFAGDVIEHMRGLPDSTHGSLAWFRRQFTKVVSRDSLTTRTLRTQLLREPLWNAVSVVQGAHSATHSKRQRDDLAELLKGHRAELTGLLLDRIESELSYQQRQAAQQQQQQQPVVLEPIADLGDEYVPPTQKKAGFSI